MPWPNRPRRHPLENGACWFVQWAHSEVLGEQPAADVVPTPSEQHLSMWEGLQRSAEHTAANLGGVEIRGKLGKEFTVKAMK